MHVHVIMVRRRAIAQYAAPVEKLVEIHLRAKKLLNADYGRGLCHAAHVDT
jgi:hypothetical protein